MFDAFIIEKIREEEENAANRRYEQDRPGLEQDFPDVLEEDPCTQPTLETPRGVIILGDEES